MTVGKTIYGLGKPAADWAKYPKSGQALLAVVIFFNHAHQVSHPAPASTHAHNVNVIGTQI